MILKLSRPLQLLFDKKHQNFTKFMNISGTVFRAVKNRQTLSFNWQNSSYFIKKHYGTSKKEIIKNLASFHWPVTSAQPEWRAIKKLSQIEILTTPLVGYGKWGFLPTKKISFVITTAIQDIKTLEDICETWQENPPSFSYRKELVKNVALLTKKLHNNGLNHRDLYLCHFALQPKKSNTELYLMDLHRVQIRKKVPNRKLIKDLGSLYFSTLNYNISTKDILRFLQMYFSSPLRSTLKIHHHLLNKAQKRAIKLYYKDCVKNNYIRIRNRHSFILCNKNYLSPEMQQILEKPDKHILENQLLTGEDTCAVAKVVLETKTIVIKRFNPKNMWHKINRLIRPTRASTCFKNAFMLKANGFLTPKPIAIIEKKHGPFRSTAYYISEYCSGKYADAYFNENRNIKETTAQTKKLAKILLSFKQKNIRHGDTKANNFIVTENGIYLVDLDSIRQYSSLRYRLSNTETKDRKRFMKNWQNNSTIKTLFNEALNG